MTRREGFESQPATATPLSRHRLICLEKRGYLRLAWQSLLCLSVMTLVASCIVADPPTYTDPVTTRPELSALGAKPSIYQVVVIPPSTTPTFQVPVRSEDAGDPLLANFWIDYGTSKVEFLDSQLLPASTYNDTTDREVSFTWTTSAARIAGCHTITFVVAHRGSYSTSAQLLDPAKALVDAAIVTWWVNLNPDANALTTLVGCPTQQSVTVK